MELWYFYRQPVCFHQPIWTIDRLISHSRTKARQTSLFFITGYHLPSISSLLDSLGHEISHAIVVFVWSRDAYSGRIQTRSKIYFRWRSNDGQRPQQSKKFNATLWSSAFDTDVYDAFKIQYEPIGLVS